MTAQDRSLSLYLRESCHRSVAPVILGLLVALAGAPVAMAQPVDCDARARAFANSYLGNGTRDLDILDGAMGGAVAGGEWRGERGAQRGARAGAALGVLDNLASYPGGWQGLYDMAYQSCRQENSSITHRPRSLGDPTYRGTFPRGRYPEPQRAPAPLEPQAPPLAD